MSRGDLLKKLFVSHMKRNDDSFQNAALEIIAEEQQKNHLILADELQRILSNNRVNSVVAEPHYDLNSLPKDKERQSLLLEVRKAKQYLPDIILPKDTKETILRVMEEYRRSEILKSHGVNPSTRLLFCGPPGCGKTMLAEVIAAELGLPILYTRFDAIVSSYLGETSANLRKVFDYATRGTWVIFFDEFDAIGKSRDDLTEHGELKRVINSFLQLLDGFHGDSIIIAATNHEYLLDIALWRRFDEIVKLEHPTIKDIQLLLHKKLASISHSKLNLESIAPRLKGLSHAEVERICLNATRLCVLRDFSELTPELFEISLKKEKERLITIHISDKQIKAHVKKSK